MQRGARLIVVFFCALLFVAFSNARTLNRMKRVSDQRLAELETLVGLTKMKGKLVTVPLALGKVDPKFIGRKRRSQQSILINRLLAAYLEPPPDENSSDDYYNRPQNN